LRALLLLALSDLADWRLRLYYLSPPLPDGSSMNQWPMALAEFLLSDEKAMRKQMPEFESMGTLTE
jgi:hypothetical protein